MDDRTSPEQPQAVAPTPSHRAPVGPAEGGRPPRELVTRYGRRVPCDDQGHWHTWVGILEQTARPHGVFACTCEGQGCERCDQYGFLIRWLDDPALDHPISEWLVNREVPTR